ncbi:MAG: NlpC/P60 family protein [Bacillota bacterium]|nr:NlpC/P60 family protein [Bacillota bacterium]
MLHAWRAQWDILRNKLFTIIMALGLVLTMNVAVSADTLDELKQQKTNAESKLRELVDANASKKKDADKLEIQIQELDSQIEDINDKLSQNKKDLTECQTKITKAEKDIKAADEEVQHQEELLDERMRAIYKNGSNGYVEIVLQAKGFTDLVARVEAVNKVMAYDKNIIKVIDEKKNELKQKKLALDEQKAKIEKIKADNENQKAELSKAKKTQRALVDKTKGEMADFDKKINNYNKLIADLNKQIEEKQRVLSRGNVVYSTNDVVNYAMTFLGVPYEWGGDGPKTFDCSGFVRYVYAHCGVYLPRTTYEQINAGTPVSRSDIQPGDLILFGTGTPHHVGMYVGNDCYIHAPQTGDVVKISLLTRTDILAIRRVR